MTTHQVGAEAQTMSSSPFRVAILTISDSAASNPAFDRSGPVLREILSASSGGSAFQVVETKPSVLPDDQATIHQTVKSLAEREDINWIITTGGTGFGTRDVTPEVSIHRLWMIPSLMKVSIGYRLPHKSTFPWPRPSTTLHFSRPYSTRCPLPPCRRRYRGRKLINFSRNAPRESKSCQRKHGCSSRRRGGVACVRTREGWEWRGCASEDGCHSDFFFWYAKTWRHL